jgi:hypothetical protein
LATNLMMVTWFINSLMMFKMMKNIVIIISYCHMLTWLVDIEKKLKYIGLATNLKIVIWLVNSLMMFKIMENFMVIVILLIVISSSIISLLEIYVIINAKENDVWWIVWSCSSCGSHIIISLIQCVVIDGGGLVY